MGSTSKRAGAAVWLLAAVVAAAVISTAEAADNPADLGCFCDCMKNQCMALGMRTKEECATACNDGCMQIGKPGQPKQDEFCGF